MTAQAPGPNVIGRQVSDAYQLLLYGVERGRDIPRDIRAAILNAQEPSGVLSIDDKNDFLAAYAKLAALMGEVTAVTLQASDRRYGLFTRARLQPWGFGVLAVLFLLAIALTEWTKTLIAVFPEAQKELSVKADELRSVEFDRKARERQRDALDAKDTARREPIDGQLDALNARHAALTARQTELTTKLKSVSGRLLLPKALRDPEIVVPLGTVIGGFLLPVLYGALGTCAYILRTMYAKVVGNCFDPSHLGEFVIRLFLGMVSGVALQWLFVGDKIPAGVTPAVLAFVGGYSVELLFTAIDRILTSARAAIQPAESPPAVAPPAAVPPPKVTAVSMAAPAEGTGARTVTIDGESFGASAGTVRVDGTDVRPATWTDKQVVFELPKQHPSGVAWDPASPRTVQVGVAVNGVGSNTVPLTVP